MKKVLYTICFLGLGVLVNAQDSLNMTLLYNWDPDTLPTSGNFGYNEVWGYVDCSGNEYAVIGSSAMVHFFDVNVPSETREIARFTGGGITIWRDMKSYRDHVYSVCDSCNEGLMVFSMEALPDSVQFVQQTTEFFGRSHNIFIDEENGRLYAVGTNTRSNGVIILDVATNPSAPSLLSSIDLPGGYIHDLYVRDNIAYMNHGNNGLYIYDFTDVQNPILLGTFDEYPQSGYNHSSWLTDDGNHLVFCDETFNTSVKIADVSDPENIELTDLFRSKLLAPMDTTSIPHNPLIRGDLAFISYYHDGVAVFDISNPDSVHKVAYYDTELDNTNYNGFIGNWGVYPFLPSGNILASDMTNGLFVLEVQNIDLKPIEPILFPEADISLSGEQRICEYESLTLNAQDNPYHLSWIQNDSIIATDIDSITINEVAEYYFIASNLHCKKTSDTASVFVKPQPDVDILADAPLTFCDGDSVNLSISNDADFYEWSIGDAVFANDTAAVTVFDSGNYLVKAIKEGCIDNSEVVMVENIPYPTAEIFQSNDGFCPGDSVVILAWEGATSYQWFLNDDSLINETNQFLVVTTAGDYSVIVNNRSCETTSITGMVDAYEIETPNIFIDDNFLTTDFAFSYQWYLNDAPIEEATGKDYFITETGLYRVETIDINGCMAVSDEIEIIFSNTHELNLSKDFTVFPNPTEQSIFINFLDKTMKDLTITLTNIQGQILEQKSIVSLIDNYEIELYHLPAGVYYLHLSNENGIGVKKVIKK